MYVFKENVIIIEDIIENERFSCLKIIIEELNKLNKKHVAIYINSRIEDNEFKLLALEKKIEITLQTTDNTNIKTFFGNAIKRQSTNIILFLSNEEEEFLREEIEYAALVGYKIFILVNKSNVSYEEVKCKIIKYKEGVINKLKEF